MFSHFTQFCLPGQICINTHPAKNMLGKSSWYGWRSGNDRHILLFYKKCHFCHLLPFAKVLAERSRHLLSTTRRLSSATEVDTVRHKKETRFISASLPRKFETKLYAYDQDAWVVLHLIPKHMYLNGMKGNL